MTTIKDVARLAKVSITTASYALNSKGSISNDTRSRVLSAAEELNYHPNAFAQNLKKQKTLTIGVFISRFGGLFYDEILEGIHDTLLKTDYELLVCPETNSVHKILTHRQVDGAIVFDSKIKNETILKLASNTFPIFVLDRYLESKSLFPLLVDNVQGTRDVFYHLYDQGIRNMAFVSGALDSFDNSERTRAFLSEAQKFEVPVACYSGNFTEASGYAAGTTLIRSGKLPEAVFCANDQMAIGFLRAMSEHKLKAPQDIAVVGFDDIQIARYIQPSLTTVGTSRFAWGAQAAGHLLEYLEHHTPFTPYRLPVNLIQRESSIRFAAAAPKST